MTKPVFATIASEALSMNIGKGYVYRLDGHVMSGCLFDSAPNVKGKFFCKLFVCLLTGAVDGVKLDLSENVKIPKILGKRTDIWGAEGQSQHKKFASALRKRNVRQFFARNASLQGIIDHTEQIVWPQFGDNQNAWHAAVLADDPSCAIVYLSRMVERFRNAVPNEFVTEASLQSKIQTHEQFIEMLEQGDSSLLRDELINQSHGRMKLLGLVKES